ncbi:MULTISPECIES: hypothetical protein [unclassified Polaribacter]|uniref:hypothetical protein n=1 Tax=unclassified Polaribacter TaxID=196858 RepID=UPI0011BF7D1F|nr:MULTISPECIES: hypothetical protein [unclassified Polaribacter]TXD52014.1 hypothetical protein ES043_09835 [Polaribacter sp. IC063]TXD56325.1 hypothetical protein ES044_17015 [Polaribacter sp. IC066]
MEKDLQSIRIEITELTTTIETNYPELYKNLDENPITLPERNHADTDKQVLQDYLESLKQLIKHHI